MKIPPSLRKAQAPLSALETDTYLAKKTYTFLSLKKETAICRPINYISLSLYGLRSQILSFQVVRNGRKTHLILDWYFIRVILHLLSVPLT